jgi:F-type H+-transporting ATPase subunit alpha
LSKEDREIISVIKEQIEHFDTSLSMVDVGAVVEIGDGVARIHGLRGAKYNELLEFPNNITGLALNLEEDNVAAVILGDYSKIKEGDEVRCTGKVVEVPVGEELIGRVVNPLGEPIDDKGPLGSKTTRPVERVAPNVTARQPVDTPVHTGVKIVDALIPIGRGQRELIIGDRSIGKSAIALDTIISQKGTGVICIYVAIGQKVSKVAQVIDTFKKYGAMEHTIVVVASAADPAALQYLAPYTGCAMAEEFMEKGKDALII